MSETGARVADPHAVLGVGADATPEQARQAFTTLAQIYHPDRYAEASPKVKDEAGRRMRELNDAFHAFKTRSTRPQLRQEPTGAECSSGGRVRGVGHSGRRALAADGGALEPHADRLVGRWSRGLDATVVEPADVDLFI